MTRTNEEWKRILNPDQYKITREKGTEAPFSSPLNEIHEQGIFECVACELPLFSSAAKFDSGTGWPSFWQPIAKENVREEWTTACRKLALKCYVRDAILTSGMFSRMVLDPPACAIA